VGAPGRCPVPDRVIEELRSREKNGIIQLPKKPQPAGSGFSLNERVRVRTGVMRGLFGLYAGQRPRNRVAILMQLLGGQ
jgi:transcription antitermination factor NusG